LVTLSGRNEEVLNVWQSATCLTHFSRLKQKSASPDDETFVALASVYANAHATMSKVGHSYNKLANYYKMFFLLYLQI
jgi:hypothetical protein